MTTKFNNETNDYAGINLSVKVNGKMVNLGSLFVTNKGSSAISKELYELLEAGALDASDVTVAISGTFSSDDVKETHGANAFKS